MVHGVGYFDMGDTRCCMEYIALSCFLLDASSTLLYCTFGEDRTPKKRDDPQCMAWEWRLRLCVQEDRYGKIKAEHESTCEVFRRWYESHILRTYIHTYIQ